ncbi:hypothetical protein BAZSYMB_V2SCAFFOLD00054_0 [Bathymodiolus azoricus thioautotrophic gill symbiont]|uniref:Uncharacterized protein n=1 Tax=Bathymodiolus azoricus thioautotrophic gill symbiont TaxID=235205 RepID=A0A1H6J061_9GAMM|nr:hypothetical protein BAZSYMB_V2SCAFFOLD00054_0 [Bathymodiolus azoricus thioautotrophic gill symbiont]
MYLKLNNNKAFFDDNHRVAPLIGHLSGVGEKTTAMPHFAHKSFSFGKKSSSSSINVNALKLFKLACKIFLSKGSQAILAASFSPLLSQVRTAISS